MNLSHYFKVEEWKFSFRAYIVHHILIIYRVIYIVASNEERQSLLIRKLRQCCILFDFTNSACDLKGKEMKRQTLQELIEYVSTSNDTFQESAYMEMIHMVILKNSDFESHSPIDEYGCSD